MADVTSPFGFPYPEDTDLVRDGAQDIENLATGVNDYLTGGYLYAGTIYYTSSGNFVKADPFGTGDIGLRAIRVRCYGAGGGAGGAPAAGSGQASTAGSGSGGAYAESFITDIAGLDASVTVTRGAGGNGGTAGGAGSDGGDSSFGALVSAIGGASGFPGTLITTFPSFAVFAVSDARVSTAGDVRGATYGVEQFTFFIAFNNFVRGGSPGGSLGGSRIAGVNAAPAQSPLTGGGAPAAVSATQPARDGGQGGNGLVIVDCFV